MDMVRVKELAETVFANGVSEEDGMWSRNLHTTRHSAWLRSSSIGEPHIEVRYFDGEIVTVAFQRCTTKEHFERALSDLEEYAIDVVNAKEKK